MLFFEIVGAYYGAFFIWQLVTGIMNMLSGKILGGMKFHSIRFLNFKIGESQGRLTLSKDRVCFLPQFKILHTPESMADKRRRTVALSAGAFSGFTVYGMFCLLVYRLAAGTEFFRMFILGAIIVFAFGLYQFLIMIFSGLGNSTQAVMQRKNEQILSFMMEGTHPAQLGDWLAEEVELSGAGLAEKNKYIQFQYFSALEMGDEERVSQLIHKMEEALPQNVPDFLGGICGELIFYYSYLEKDLSKAERYKNQAPSMIENDMDLNGRRVYAYYLYGKEADTDKILEVIAEGLAVAQEYQMPGNIPMETKLLQYLRDLL